MWGGIAANRTRATVNHCTRKLKSRNPSPKSIQRVRVAILALTGEDHICRATNAQIAAKSKLHRETVKVIIAGLHTDALVAISKKWSPGYGWLRQIVLIRAQKGTDEALHAHTDTIAAQLDEWGKVRWWERLAPNGAPTGQFAPAGNFGRPAPLTPREVYEADDYDLSSRRPQRYPRSHICQCDPKPFSIRRSVPSSILSTLSVGTVCMSSRYDLISSIVGVMMVPIQSRGRVFRSRTPSPRNASAKPKADHRRRRRNAAQQASAHA